MLGTKIVERHWWVPDEAEVWTLATQSSEELPNGCVNFLVHKSRVQVTFPLSKCLPANNDETLPEDLVFLSEVNPASILACTRKRFNDRRIYTSIGLVLMTVNPFEIIPGLYSKSQIKKYEYAFEQDLPAHVYQVPARAYYNMCSSGADQSILISGESGAGKIQRI